MTGKLAVVIGGSGFVGRHVVRELAKRGWRVRVGVRRPHLATHLKPMGVVGQIQLAQVNVRYPKSVEQALIGADAVINCTGILFQELFNQKFDRIHTQGAASIAQACKEAGVKNLIYISAIGADAQSESLYARSKGEGENAVLEAMPDATILRPSIIFGPEDQFFNRFAAMAQIAPALPLIGGGKTKFQPVYVDDVADAACACLESHASAGLCYELGGPNVYTFRELMELMLKETRLRRLLVPVPFFAANIMGLGGEISGWLPFIEPFLTRDQVKLLENDNIVDEASGQSTIADLGIAPKSIEAVLPSYLQRFRKYGQFSQEPEASPVHGAS